MISVRKLYNELTQYQQVMRGLFLGQSRYLSLMTLLMVCIALGLVAAAHPGHGPDFLHYLALVRSIHYSHDVLLINEFLEMQMPLIITETGYGLELRNLGTALFWLPWHIISDITMKSGLVLRPEWEIEEMFLTWADWLYAVIAGAMIFMLCHRRWGWKASLLSLALTFIGTPFGYYASYVSPSPHIISTLLATLLIYVWDRSATLPRLSYWAVMGSFSGLLLLIANYNAAFLVFPILDLFETCRSRSKLRSAVAGAAVFLSSLLLGLAPQLFTWQAMYGSMLAIPYRHQMSWLHPAIIQVLTSPYHGLLFTAPIVFLAILGWISLARCDQRLSVRALLAFCALTYMVGANLAWWAGASFGARYFISISPLITLGIGAWFQGKYKAAKTIIASILALWTVLLFVQNVSGTLSEGGYYPWYIQLQGQRQALSDLFRLLVNPGRLPLIGGSFAVVLLVISFCFLYGCIGVGRLFSQKPGLVAMVAALLVSLVMPVIGVIMYVKSQQQQQQFVLNSGYSSSWCYDQRDRVDLSESYLERGTYYLQQGYLSQAQNDLVRAYELFPWKMLASVSPDYASQAAADWESIKEYAMEKQVELPEIKPERLQNCRGK